ncbi:MAG: sulfotransferase [Bacteroidales bacterium]|nr:sulfotransferase [Bacteroidales bacterium]
MKDIISLLDRMYNKVQVDLQELPKEKWFEVRFGEFEKDPVEQLKKMYEHFSMAFTDEYVSGLKEKLFHLKEHKKNKYVLSDEHKELIREKLKKHFVYYNYEV